jgi:hypothetical protein
VLDQGRSDLARYLVYAVSLIGDLGGGWSASRLHDP